MLIYTTDPSRPCFSPAMGKKKTEYETPKMMKAGVKICRPAVAELPGAKVIQKFSEIDFFRSQKESRN